MDELVRQLFRATGDPREVVTDANAGYFCMPVNDQSLTPTGDSRIDPTRYRDWLMKSLALA